MKPSNKSSNKINDILDSLIEIVQLVFQTEKPLSHAQEIVKKTALSQGADISTLFIVEGGNKLKLVGGVAYLNNKEIVLPKDHEYELDWDKCDENDMKEKGLTAFVATNGKPLYVNSYEELVDKTKHPSHDGKWDKHIYPDGLNNESTGFRCFYAVPLRHNLERKPRETVMGVFKIERRRNRLAFTDQERKIFDLIAAHLSLILQAFYNVQNRVFSDVAHAIGGGLGRSYSILTMIQDILKGEQTDKLKFHAYVEEHLPSAVSLFDKAIKRLNNVLDASRDPNRIVKEPLKNLLNSIKSEVELKSNIKLNSSNIVFMTLEPLKDEAILNILSLQYYDLCSILGNILENAIRYAGSKAPVILKVEILETDMVSKLMFSVIDKGEGISAEILKEVVNTEYAEIYRLPGTDGVVKGTGLKRAFGLSKYNQWEIKYKKANGSTIELIVPDYRIN